MNLLKGLCIDGCENRGLQGLGEVGMKYLEWKSLLNALNRDANVITNSLSIFLIFENIYILKIYSRVKSDDHPPPHSSFNGGPDGYQFCVPFFDVYHFQGLEIKIKESTPSNLTCQGETMVPLHW